MDFVPRQGERGGFNFRNSVTEKLQIPYSHVKITTWGSLNRSVYKITRIWVHVARYRLSARIRYVRWVTDTNLSVELKERVEP